MSEKDPMQVSTPPGHSGGPGHERSDADTKKVVMFLVVLAAIIVAACLSMWGVFVYLNAHQPPTGPPRSLLVKGRQLPPLPRLQISETEDIGALVAAENKRLDSYGWIDKDGGIAYIPIQRAMDLILERGIPGGTNAPAKSSAPGSTPVGVSTPRR